MLALLALAALASLARLPAASAQFQQFQTQAQRDLLLLVQDIQNQLIQQQQQQQGQLQGLLRQQQDQLQAQAVAQAVTQVLQQPVQPPVQPPVQRRVISVATPAQAQRVLPTRTRQRQRPPANDTAKPQFLEPGVGRWLLNGDPACLPCICEAASGCDETLGCDDRGFCGPFLLSKRYWTLAGKPLLRGDSADRPGAPSDCLRDPFCAAEAVRGYLDKFAQDCDGDRRVDCLDLARVHFQGPFNCRSPLQPPTDFSDSFRRCWDASRQGQAGGPPSQPVRR